MAASQIYPLSTQDGKAIPLDIASPLALLFYALVANTKKDISIPAGWSIAYLYSTVDCIFSLSNVDLPAALVDGTIYSEAIFIPATTPMIILVAEGDGSILPLATGSVYISKLERWGALVQSVQSSMG